MKPRRPKRKPTPRVAGEPARRVPAAAFTLHGRLWIQSGTAAAFTESGADLLEQIAACGSLSEAARRLRFSYRRAWLLVDAMNKHWPEPLVSSAVGGTNGGGTQVTELGRQVLVAYRDLQFQLEHLLDQASEPFRASTGTSMQ